MSIVNQTIVERHAEDAAFLWLLRDRAVVSPRYSHRQMQALDQRIDAHLDGLRVAGDYGWGCCAQQLRSWGEPDEVFAAAALAFDTDEASRWHLVLDRASGDPQRERAVVAASGWHPLAKVEPRLRAWWGSAEPGLRALGLGGLLAHRVDPGASLGVALTVPDSPLLATAVRAAGELGRVDLVGPLRALSGSSQPELRLAAARALARLGANETPVVEALLSVAESSAETEAEPAIESLIRLAPELGQECYRRWRVTDRARAVHAAVVLGTPEVIEDLLEWMRDDALARLAGRAFSAILGVDLEHDDLDRDGPRSGPDDEDEDAIVAEDPRLAGLPWPSVFAATRWWRERSDQFSPGLRYLAGEPSNYTHLIALAKHGRPWWRALASSDLAQSVNDLPRIETRAPTGRLHCLPGAAAWPESRTDDVQGVLDVG